MDAERIRIGAWYPCYKQPKAVLEALRSFRKHYPASTIVMTCAGGDDLSALARSFNCHYFHFEDNLGEGKSIYPKTMENFLEFFRRLFYAFQFIQEDYVLLLEDDVKVLHPVDTKELVFTISGGSTFAASWKNERVIDFLTREAHTPLNKNKLPHPRYTYFSGCGGTIWNRKFFMEIGAARWLTKLSECL